MIMFFDLSDFVPLWGDNLLLKRRGICRIRPKSTPLLSKRGDLDHLLEDRFYGSLFISYRHYTIRPKLNE